MAEEVRTAEEVRIGIVSGYYAQIGVASIDLTGTLKVGDSIHIKGHTTDFQQVVDSMQIEHDSVSQAEAGQAVGIKVGERVRRGDQVYQVTE